MKIKTVSITDDQAEEIGKMAKELGINFSDMLRRILHEYLKLKENENK